MLLIDVPLMAHLIQCGGHNPKGEDYHLVWGQECFEYFFKVVSAIIMQLCAYRLSKGDATFHLGGTDRVHKKDTVMA